MENVRQPSEENSATEGVVARPPRLLRNDLPASPTPRIALRSCHDYNDPSAAPRRGAAGVALEAGAVADHGEVAAFGAGFADVAFHARFGAFLRDGLPRRRADGERSGFGERAFER